MILVWMLVHLLGFGQVGDDTTPMKYSTHIYSITMGVEGNTPLWRIFNGHLTVNEIESGAYTALVRNVDYGADPDAIVDGDALFTVEFNGNMAAGNYTIAYKENNEDECFKTKILPIVLQEAFDVDVEDLLGAQTCPDLSNLPQQPEFDDFQTVITYTITMATPAIGLGYVDEWAFNYKVLVQGQTGSIDGTIAKVEIDFNDDGIDDTQTPVGSVSLYTNSVTVPNLPPDNLIYTVVLNVYINDVLGDSQDIELELSGIEGSYSEFDSDANNKTNIVVLNMPDVGDIEPLN